jgi:Holliday junction resolvase
MKFSEKRKGDINEITVCNILLKDGHEVFRNLCCTGLVDVVAIKNNNIILLDVKSPLTYKNKLTLPKLSDAQKKLGVIPVCVYDDKLYWKDTVINAEDKPNS